jgi:two-component system response regulator
MTTKTILLVEDNVDDVELTLRAFQTSAVRPEIHVTRDGTEALESLFGSTDRPPPAVLPALVLLDLKLPGLSGFDVLSVIRANPRTRMLPVVILTSSAELVDLVTGYGLGANSYVRKPTSFRDLVAAAQSISAYWLALNEAPPEGRVQ